MAHSAVRPVTPGDRDAWFRLWRGYLDFYETKLDDRVSEATWRRVLDPDEPIHGCVATDPNGRVVGIVNYVLHANTWTERPVCYLEDLFVLPDARGQGVGRALIEGLVSLARDAGWHRVYWMTKRDNRVARVLYDKVAPVTDWVRYDVNIGA